MALFSKVKVFYRDKLVLGLLVPAVLFLLATWALFLFKKFAQSPIAVLHFNIYAGIDILGNWYWLYIIPGLVLVISIIDIILASLLWTKQRAWSYLLLVAILIVNAMIFFYLYNILNYNL